MLRQGLIYLVLSILIVVFSRYAHLLIVYIDLIFTWVTLKLTPIFSHTGWGLIVRKTIVLTLIPIILTSIPALIYKLIKKRDMPHYFPILWIFWTIIVLSDILIV